jgi:hypothetical protein
MFFPKDVSIHASRCLEQETLEKEKRMIAILSKSSCPTTERKRSTRAPHGHCDSPKRTACDVEPRLRTRQDGKTPSRVRGSWTGTARRGRAVSLRDRQNIQRMRSSIQAVDSSRVVHSHLMSSTATIERSSPSWAVQ